MIVKDLINKLKEMPQDKAVFCQVVAEDGTAWNMFFEIHDLSNSSMVVLQVYHPELKTMPDFIENED